MGLISKPQMVNIVDWAADMVIEKLHVLRKKKDCGSAHVRYKYTCAIVGV